MGEIEPGLHWMPPYYRIAYVVSKQAATYDAPVALCPTSDDVRVNVDLVVVFSVCNPSEFIYRLGAANFDDFLHGAVDEGIRMLVRKESHKTVYSLRGDRADFMLEMLNDKFKNAGIKFTDVKVTTVWLPDELADSLENTTRYAKSKEKLERENEYEMLQIRQSSDMAIEEIKRKSEQVLVSEAGRKKRAELEFEQRSVKAEEDGRINMIEAETQVEVQKMAVLTQLSRTKTELETYRVTELAKADAQAAATKIKAEMDFEAATIEAGWQQEKMICDAEATKHEADAEALASKCLVAQRKHELSTREKTILAGLAAKGDFNLTGSAGDTIVGAMMSGNIPQSGK